MDNLIIPNILTAEDCSLVITDTSGELFQQTSGYLKSQGYEVQALNLINPSYGFRYNPLAHVKNAMDAEHIAHIIVNAAGGHTSEPIWDDGAKRLIRILTQAVKNAKGEVATLSDVVYWLNNFDAHSRGGALDDFVIENTQEDRATFEDYKGFTKTAPENMMLSFVSTAATALSLIGNPDLSRLCCHQDFDFQAMKDRKIALYVMVRQQDMGTFSFLLSLFYTELCNALLTEVRGRLPVYLMLDEFGHLTIPGFQTFPTTARK
ncbi:type IV secretory system conjugative DNA transfer family protein [Terasakiella sp. SH-1]|uniref:type IV secretory system conjugative DNA transfer family protein n=1 Tax=Terasakiella sp. SH-1 TaxID=2560057 RepID=UPI001430268F|nr:type IV secretory system conjugative DNA transfer family protein [Terasakiella sp. SH-1]